MALNARSERQSPVAPDFRVVKDVPGPVPHTAPLSTAELGPCGQASETSPPALPPSTAGARLDPYAWRQRCSACLVPTRPVFAVSMRRRPGAPPPPPLRCASAKHCGKTYMIELIPTEAVVRVHNACSKAGPTPCRGGLSAASSSVCSLREDPDHKTREAPSVPGQPGGGRAG